MKGVGGVEASWTSPTFTNVWHGATLVFADVWHYDTSPTAIFKKKKKSKFPSHSTPCIIYVSYAWGTYIRYILIVLKYKFNIHKYSLSHFFFFFLLLFFLFNLGCFYLKNIYACEGPFFLKKKSK